MFIWARLLSPQSSKYQDPLESFDRWIQPKSTKVISRPDISLDAEEAPVTE